MAFIGRPQIPYDQFRREDLPGTGETLVNTLSQILQNYTANQQLQNRGAIPVDQAIATGLIPAFTGGRTVNLPDGTPITIGQQTPAKETYGTNIRGPVAEFLTKKRAEEAGMEKAVKLKALADEADEKKRKDQEARDLLTPEEQSVLEKMHKLSAGSLKGVRRGVLTGSLGKSESTGIRTEAQLRGELNKLGTDFRSIQAAYSKIQTIANNAPSAAGDLSLIFSYMKLLDPGSTVREGEQATAENARGVPERILNLHNKILRGEKLTPEQRTDFLNQSEKQFETQKSIFDQQAASYRELAGRKGVNPENVDIGLGNISTGGNKIPLTGKSAASGYSSMSTEELMKKAMEQINGKR